MRLVGLSDFFFSAMVPLTRGLNHAQKKSVDMEGNLSLKDARAAASDADDAAADTDALGSDTGAWSTSTKRRKRLLRMAIFATGLWLGLFAAGLIWARMAGQLSVISPAHVAVFITAAGVPLCLIWIVSLVLQRADPLLERRLAIARTLNSTIAPVDAAEAKLDRMLERLRRDIGTVDQTVLLASERISALEDRFKDQVSELFSATTDAEARSASIREQLKRERESMEGLTELLESHLSDIRATMADATDTTIQAEMKSRDAFLGAAGTFEEQYSKLMKASGTAVDGISQVMNGLAERTTALDAAALAATQKLGKGISALKAHEGDYRGFIDQFSADFKAFDATIDARLVSLEAAQARLDSNGTEVSTTLSDLAAQTHKSVDEALTQAQAASAALAKHQYEVTQTSSDILESLSQQQATSRESLDLFQGQLADMRTALGSSIEAAMQAHDTAGETFESVLGAHVLSWQKALKQFSTMLTHDTERAGSIAASRLLRAGESVEQALGDIHEKTNEAVSSQASDIRALAADMDTQLNAARDALEMQRSDLKTQMDEMTAQRAAISGVAKDLSNDILHLPDRLSSEVAGVKQSLEAGYAQLSESAIRLEKQVEGLSTLDTLWQPQIEALSAQTAEIEKTQRAQIEDVAALSNTLEERCQRSISALRSAIAELNEGQNETAQSAKGLEETLVALQQRAQSVQEDIGANAAQLTSISDGFKAVQSLASDINQFDASALQNLPAELSERLQEVSQASAALEAKAQESSAAILATYEKTIAQAGTFTQTLSDNVSDTLRWITQDADRAVDLARMKWASLSEDRQSAALASVETFSASVVEAIQSHSSTITQKLQQLDSATQESLQRLASETVSQVKDSEETLRRVRALTKRINEDKQSDLIKSSSLIIDALNSSAIDISKAMSADLTDAEWNRYLEGDKSLFTRRTVDLISKQDREAIAKKLDRDNELKQAARHYLKDFELLMSRAMAGGEPTSLSVTLISSDMGKLYVTLSQAMRRIN
ncbi:MAG: hypothetical protein AAF337_06735 [Pseudomonadota bacterium]